VKIAIVTGASSGIGREFAKQIQGEYDLDELWLIALESESEGLQKVADEFPGLKSVVIPMDLTSGHDLDNLRGMIDQSKPEISVLVNNAGYAHIGTFSNAPLDHLHNMVDLNVKALMELSHMTIPYMGTGSTIFQVASISAFLPGPTLAAYAASKAFVLSFSQSLYCELKERGIHVMSVSPGPVATNFWNVASSGEMDAPANASAPKDVVQRAIKDAKAKKINSTLGFEGRLTISLSRILNRKFHLKMLSGGR